MSSIYSRGVIAQKRRDPPGHGKTSRRSAPTLFVRQARRGSAPAVSGDRLQRYQRRDGAHEHPTQACSTPYYFREKGPLGPQVTFLATSCTAASPARTSGPDQARGKRTSVARRHSSRVSSSKWVPVTHKLRSPSRCRYCQPLAHPARRQRLSAFPSIGEYRSLFGLTSERFARLKPDAIVMHPGPVNRGVEIEARLRSPALNHPRPGDQRPCRAHGGDVPR
ncbi:MAG: hypothetical protein Ct9H300mP32_2930 [Verrucomicrobiota bacterium]|nr:MAG: hypothetical protein Ct9H300mP32_2930 [Verrucomicrobiota bacterium]